MLRRCRPPIGVDVEVTVTDFGQFVPKTGSLICHTGDSILDNRVLSKDEVKSMVESRGYTFTDELRKSDKISLLLVADDGHESGKTRKAEQWGIPMMTIKSFVEVTAVP